MEKPSKSNVYSAAKNTNIGLVSFQFKNEGTIKTFFKTEN